MIPYPKEGFLGIVLGMHAKRFENGTRANLRGANLRGANLRGANLRDANLRDADLWDANLWDANLWDANLRDADLWDADLWDADLRGADLQGADLRGADLQGANLRGADLEGADLEGADLRNLVGQGSKQMVCVQTPYWAVVMTPDQMAIGCEQHAVIDWWAFSDDRIEVMDSLALEFWRVWKPVLQQVHANAFGGNCGAERVEDECDAWLESEGVSPSSPEAWWATRAWMRVRGYEWPTQDSDQ